MDDPEVSVILPTQGKRASLAEALRSALGQRFPSFEVVVVDDTADTVEWRSHPAWKSMLEDRRVRVVPFHRSRGCAAAKNAGLRAARGRWVCYLDDDNEYCPGKIDAQYGLATQTGSPLVLCGLEVRAGFRRRLRQVDREWYEGDELFLDALADTNVLFHRAESGLAWDESLGTVDDTCFFHAFVARAGLRTVPNVPRPLACYHAHGGPRANRDFDRHYRGHRRLIVKWSRNYSRRARRIMLARTLVSFCKFARGGWFRLMVSGWRLIRIGGWKEWRVVGNAVGVKLPLVRRWMVT